jgi:uncharacterized damage-inducible protein DinB
MIRLKTVLDSWSAVREDTAQAVSDFPPEAVDEILVEGCMSFRGTAKHILESSQGFTGALLAGVESFAVPNLRDVLSEYQMPLPEDCSMPDLAEALQESLRDRVAAFQEQPEAFWTREIVRHDGKRATPLEFLQFLKEHELTHRSQMFMFLRLRGIVPPTTRRRETARRQAV